MFLGNWKTDLIWKCVCLVVGLFIFLVPSRLASQIGQSGITGTITDSSRAVVPNANIAIENEATGAQRTTTSGTGGLYIVRSMPPGSYTVTVQATGFEKAVVQHIATEVDKISTADISLTVGSVRQETVVTSTPNLLTTTGGTVGTLVTEAQIEALPIDGRSYVSFVFLSPGAVNYAGGTATSSGVTTGVTPVNFVVNGLRSANNVYFIDGVDQLEPESGILNIYPPLDALAEFRVETNNYPADYVGGGGAVVSLVTKSGTNQFHGSAWEYLRNNVFDAQNFFSTEVPELQQNQFGAAVGGPIRKDKLFFFGSYEGFRQRQGVTLVGDFPTALERTGNLSDLPGQVVDPLTGIPFPGNIIPNNRINPLNASFMNKYIPLPNTDVPIGSGNYRRIGSQPINWNSVIGRADMNFSAKSRLFARYMYTKSTNGTALLDANWTNPKTQPGHDVGVDYVRTLSPTTVAEGRFGYHYFYHSEPSGTSFGGNVAEALGVQNAVDFNPNPAAQLSSPTINVSGFATFGGSGLGIPRDWFSQFFSYNGSLSMTRGSHLLRVGGVVDRTYSAFEQGFLPVGDWEYTGFFSNSGVGDYLLGYPRTLTVGVNTATPHLRNLALGLWAQDDWKVTENLTLNLGMRWDLNGRFTEEDGHIANWDLGTPPNATEIFPSALPPGWNKTLLDTPRNDFSPRVGFAYKLKGNTVVRGGYGIFFQPMMTDPVIGLGFNPPFFLATFQTLNQSDLPTFDRANPLTTSGGAGTLAVVGDDKHFKDGYVGQWNLTFEHSLRPNNLISIAYVGDEGTHLVRFSDPTAAPPGPGPIGPRRPYDLSVQWRDSFAKSNYNGLQVKAERRSSKNLSFTAAYAFGKAIDDNDGTYIESSGEPNQQVNNSRAERDIAGFDVKHTFSIGYIYSLPFGADQRFAGGLTGVTNKLVSGWQLSGLTVVTSGFPLQIYMATDSLNTGAQNEVQYPNRICNPNDYSRGNLGEELAHFFNTACFTAAPAFTYGTSDRHPVFGPGNANFDLALAKHTRITERVGMEFRAEFFNALNHPNFGQPDGVFGTPGFGAITSAANPRIIQFGLRFTF